MSLTLNATLETAQSSQSRHPLVEIIASNAVADIPFDGQYLHPSEPLNEQKPNVLMHSTGRICLVYIHGDAGGTIYLKYVYTDVDRTVFSIPISITITGQTPIEASICELVNGDIGIVYLRDSGAWELRYIVVSPVGVVITSDTLIATYAKATYTIMNPWVSKLADNSFFMIYIKETIAGATYEIMKRTAAAFGTFSAESALSIAGLTNTDAIYNPSLVQISTGDIWLWFEYVDSVGPSGEELTNIYYSVSSDNGANWGAGTAETAYATYGEVAKHPIAVQKTANQMHLIYHEQLGALRMDNTSGWCGTYVSPIDITFDPVSRKLYVVSVPTYVARNLSCVVKIDVDSWTVEDCRKGESDTTPGFPDNFCLGTYGNVWYYLWRGDRYLIPVGVASNLSVSGQISVWDGEADTITDYIFKTTGGLVQNCVIPNSETYGWELAHAHVIFDQKRLYLLFISANATHKILVGYIDLTEILGGSGMYSFTTIVDTGGITEPERSGLVPGSGGPGEFIVYPNEGLFVISMGMEAIGNEGRLQVYDLATGGLIKDYSKVNGSALNQDAAFPHSGLRSCILLNNKIYGGFGYSNGAGEVDKRGLCCIDLNTDAITFIRPDWATVDDYGIWKITTTDDGRLIINCYGYGVSIYNPVTDQWLLYSNDNLPGMTADGTEDFGGDIAYDSSQGLVFTGCTGVAAWNGLVMFSEYGFIKQAQYQIGTFSGGAWSFSANLPIVQGYLDFELVLALDLTDQSIYAFWTRQDATDYLLKWDKENAQLNISDYIVRGTEVSCKRSIDGTPSTLSFTVSHGHLFDPHNALSLWSIYLSKFSKLNLRWGENIGGTEYWQQAGIFYVVSDRVTYQRPNYPIMEVQAEDRRALLEYANVTTTYYDGEDPKTILEDLLTDHMNFVAGDMNFPVFDAAQDLWAQWIDTDLLEILKQICHRFCYYLRTDIDGKVSARKIAIDNAIDHAYSDLTKLISFSPDDSFSDWTNQVTVTGEARDYIEVLFAEERIREISGSVGWFGGIKTKVIYYSDDKSRRCRYPRLEIIQSVADFQCLLNLFPAGGDEWIESSDSNDKYVVIVIDRPDKTEDLIALIAALAATVGAYAIWEPTGLVGKAMIMIIVMLLVQILNILSGQALYHYAIWAKPIGKVRQSYSGTADDLDLQTLINAVVQKKFADSLCHSSADCNFVAEFELLVAKYQRKRVSFEKMADLRDEDGDTLTMIHPHSGLAMNLFVTDLTRKFKIPSSVESNDGYFLDAIEAWNIT